jgi:hypothetical protein
MTGQEALRLEETIARIIDKTPVAQELAPAIESGDITQEDIDETRNAVIQTIDNPSLYPEFKRYMAEEEFPVSVPESFDLSFMLFILGICGLAQRGV